MGFDLIDLKREYSVLEKKYGLPSFKELNEGFDIEKIDAESDLLLKMIRKVCMEKITNVIGFLEMLLNPQGVPRMYVGFVNSMGESDRNEISEIYGKLAMLFLVSLEAEVKYSEKFESEVIGKIYGVWMEVSDDLKDIIGKIKKPNNLTRKEKSYFG